MNSEFRKELLIDNLRGNVSDIRILITEELEKLVENEKELLIQVRRAQSIDQEIASQQLRYAQRRVKELESLLVSPFFAKVVYAVNAETREVYISKYEFSDCKVSSWVAPIATLRFEDLGKIIVNLPEGKNKEVDLTEKDSYVIGRDKIIYYSQETKDRGVEIIYEDFLSNVKSEYGLSEIISKIEKEQYKIIQSDAKTPLIISGPAGSGKTTICLHRVAYLLQTPETADMYVGEKMLMLVQDISTRDYFSSILPKLGIPDMMVLTYFQWGMYMLKLEEVNYTEVNMYNIDEKYLNLLQSKVKIIDKGVISFKKHGKLFIDELDKLYKKQLTKDEYNMYEQNKIDKRLDYVDVTIMLSMMEEDGDLYEQDEYYKSVGDGKYTLHKRQIPINYGMVIVDEYQNYSSDQISVIRKVVYKKTKSIVYIGDMNQRSMIKPESSNAVDHFILCKKITLDKVYRNTKNILEYIKSLGYSVEVPEGAREGDEVIEFKIDEYHDLVSKIRDIISERRTRGAETAETVGVLCDSIDMQSSLTRDLNDTGAIVMTKIESQGTEFNTVICINEKISREDASTYSEEFINMKNKVKRNADYIGYTRAVERLFVFSSTSQLI